MPVLGLSGLFGMECTDYDPAPFFGFYHDSAACLVDAGCTLAAAEEERFNREKHTNRFPATAVRACLDQAGLTAASISHVAYFFGEAYTDLELARIAADDPDMPLRPVRELLCDRLSATTGLDFGDRPVVFTSHHRAHAASAYLDSGMNQAVVLVADGNAETEGVSVFLGEGPRLRLLRAYPRSHSLGHFYAAVTKQLGLRAFDEYKVMGLASYGNPDTYRDLLAGLYTLGPDGAYTLAVADVLTILTERLGAPRRTTDPIGQRERDLAAAAQEVVERVSVHLVQHWLQETGIGRLCLAGGVAQNTSMNGRLLGLRVVEEMVVPAAPHDAGAALGAAMLVDQDLHAGRPRTPATRYSASPYLGADLGSDGAIGARLAAWGAFVTHRRPADLEDEVAADLATGAVVGLAQGRAEFGPRALGNRSILADPRRAEQRDRVNRMIKQREGYRPFGPVVAAEDAERYFAIPSTVAEHGHMSFVVPVRPEHREQLRAVTHVDGTARVQVLRRDRNPRLWRLLQLFGRHTGVPVLLNTSFNNDVEPIVQTADDVVVSLLTTRLTLAVVGPFVVQRAPTADAALALVRLRPAPFCRLESRTDRHGHRSALVRTHQPVRRTVVDRHVETLLTEQLRPADLDLPDAELDALLTQVARLWDRRLVTVEPDEDVR